MSVVAAVMRLLGWERRTRLELIRGHVDCDSAADYILRNGLICDSDRSSEDSILASHVLEDKGRFNNDHTRGIGGQVCDSTSAWVLEGVKGTVLRDLCKRVELVASFHRAFDVGTSTNLTVLLNLNLECSFNRVCISIGQCEGSLIESSLSWKLSELDVSSCTKFTDSENRV